MKATSLIFGVILMGLVMASFGLFISDMSSTYSVAWDENTTELFNKLNATETQAYELQDKLETSTDTGAIDVLGGLLTKAVDSLKLTYRSLGSAKEMVEVAGEQTGIPQFYINGIITMLIIFLVLGVIISAMVKKDL